MIIESLKVIPAGSEKYRYVSDILRVVIGFLCGSQIGHIKITLVVTMPLRTFLILGVKVSKIA
jgi:hypothetical protein